MTLEEQGTKCYDIGPEGWLGCKGNWLTFIGNRAACEAFYLPHQTMYVAAHSFGNLSPISDRNIMAETMEPG